MDKKTVLLAQFFISLSMACLMTGIFSLLEHGLTADWLAAWAKAFVTAWPIAFVLSMITSRYSFMLAHRLRKGRGAST